LAVRVPESGRDVEIPSVKRSPQAMTALGHFRQIDIVPTLKGCPLCSDRFRNSDRRGLTRSAKTGLMRRNKRLHGLQDLLDHLVGAGEHRNVEVASHYRVSTGAVE